METRGRGIDVRLTVKRFTRKTHSRASGQAARRLPRLTVQPTGDVCKRRAVRLALHEPARPAGAAFGVLSGATVSWAAPTHACNTTSHLDRDAIPLGLRYMWQNLGAGAAAGTSSPFAEFLLDKCGAWLHCSCKPRPEADKHGVLSGTAA